MIRLLYNYKDEILIEAFIKTIYKQKENNLKINFFITKSYKIEKK